MNSQERKAQPAIVQVSPGKLPEPQLFFLDNKVPVYFLEAGSEELMKLEFIFDAGLINEKVPLQSSTVNMMLTEGTQNYKAEELNNALDFYGTFLNTFHEKDAAGVSVLFITRHLKKIIELCYEMIFLPLFPESEMNALMKKRYQWFMLNREKVNFLASEQFFESIFGSNHPYGKKVSDTDFETITPAILRDFHRTFYAIQGMTIIASGKIPGETISLLNRFFGQSPVEIRIPEKYNELPEGEKSKKVFVRKTEAVQTAIRIGSATINKRNPDYPGLKVVDTILGGYFGSRLMRNLREDKGFTYGISSSVASFNLSGYKTIGTEVGIEYTQQALGEIYAEISALQNYPVERDELEIVRSFMLGDMVRMFDGPFAIAESFRAVWEFGLDNSYYYDLAKKIKTIDPDEIIHLSRTYYNIDDQYEIVAGQE